MKQKSKILLIFSICLVVGSSIVSPMAVGTPFSFILSAHGNKKSTEIVQKKNPGAAIVNVTSLSNASSFPVYVRIRAKIGDAYASQLGNITGTGKKSLSYLSGYGKKSENYYMRMQTDSNSGYSASVVGNWTP